MSKGSIEHYFTTMWAGMDFRDRKKYEDELRDWGIQVRDNEGNLSFSLFHQTTNDSWVELMKNEKQLEESVHYEYMMLFINLIGTIVGGRHIYKFLKEAGYGIFQD